MMDAYSFDADDAGATRSYLAMKAAYEAFFRADRRQRHLRRGRHRRHGRQLLPRVHGARRGGRQRPVLQRGERLRRQPREGAQRDSCPRDSPTRPRPAPSRNFPTPGRGHDRRPGGRRPTACAADRQFKTLVYIGDGKPVRRHPARLRRARGGQAGLARVHAPSAGDAGGDRAGHGRQAGQPRRRQGNDQGPAGAGGNLRRPRDPADRQRHDGRQPGRLSPAKRQRGPRPGDHPLRRLPARAGGRARPGRGPAAEDAPRHRGRATSSSSAPSTPSGSTPATPTTRRRRHLFVMGCYGIGISRTLQAVHRAEPRCRRHHLALGDRALPGAGLPARSRRTPRRP